MMFQLSGFYYMFYLILTGCNSIKPADSTLELSVFFSRDSWPLPNLAATVAVACSKFADF